MLPERRAEELHMGCEVLGELVDNYGSPHCTRQVIYVVLHTTKLVTCGDRTPEVLPEGQRLVLDKPLQS